MVTARERTLNVQGKQSKVDAKRAVPLKIHLLGYDLVLDVFSLSLGEKQTWRECITDLGPHADEADHMAALAYMMIRRQNPSYTWEQAKNEISWQVMLDAVASGTDTEDLHPEG